MRYGYDLNNPIERDTYFRKKQRDLQRMFNKDKDINQGFVEVIRETQEELKYFQQREKQEQETEKRIQQQIEKEFPKVIEKELQKVFK